MRSDNDNGVILKKNASVQTGKECQEVDNKVFDSAKYALLKQHQCPPDQLLLLSMFLTGCKGSFQRSWVWDGAWMVYSKELDGVLCLKLRLIPS